MIARLAPWVGLLAGVAFVIAGVALLSLAVALIVGGVLLGAVAILFLEVGGDGKAD